MIPVPEMYAHYALGFTLFWDGRVTFRAKH